MGIGNRYYNILGESLEQIDKTELQLSARLKADSFFYTISNSENQILVFDKFDFYSNDKLEEIQLLKLPFSKVTIALDNDVQTIVTKEDQINKDDYQLFFENLTTEIHKGIYNKDELINDSLINLYPVNHPLLDEILTLFPQANLVHYSSCLMNCAIKNTDGVHLHLNNDKIQLVVTKENNLVFYNQYKVKSENDILYYVGLIYQELKLDQNNVNLSLSGDIYPDSKSYNLLKSYFRWIDFAEMPGFKRNEALPKDLVIDTHYYDSYAISQCG